MDRTLSAVARATERKDRACADAFAHYVKACRAARAAGHTFTAIGAAAGITPQGARYIVEGDPRHNGRPS